MSQRNMVAKSPPSGLDQTCTLLVASCDRYADLWPPYFLLLRKRWPDCPFPVALITEAQQPSLDKVRALCLGTGMDWSTLMLRALDAVGTPYVLLTLEDFFLRAPVETGRIAVLFEEFQRAHLRMLRLVPRPGPERGTKATPGFGLIAANTPYRVSTQAAFWDAEMLRRLLVVGESAWQFEVNGTRRSAEYDGFAAVWWPALPYRHHVIERGKWFPWAAWQFSRLDIGVDLSARPVMTTGETIRWLIAKMTGPIVQRMPSGLRSVLKPLGRRFGFGR